MAKEETQETVVIPETNQFDFLYNVKEAVLLGLKKPFRKSSLKSGLESALRNWLEQKMDIDEKMIDIRKQLVNSRDLSGQGSALINSLVKLRRELESLDKSIVAVKEEHKIIFGIEIGKVKED
jgi:hypothetical protein